MGGRRAGERVNVVNADMRDVGVRVNVVNVLVYGPWAGLLVSPLPVSLLASNSGYVHIYQLLAERWLPMGPGPGPLPHPFHCWRRFVRDRFSHL